MRYGRLPVLVLLGVLLSGCSTNESVFHMRFFALGTLIEISIQGADPALAARASEQVEQHLLTLQSRWHAWQQIGRASCRERV